MKQSVRLATATVLLLAAMPAGADDHAIAMHGAPKYGPGFAHFDYVNPAAPKGGRLVLARTGSFDSLNPFLIKGVAAAGSDLVFERLLKRSRDEPFPCPMTARRSHSPSDRKHAFTTARRSPSTT
jgi:microcin C transport system substrate-binding protein